MDTPVLLIAWRRPQTLRQVINAIRPVAPTRLFLACDGPNPKRLGEAQKVAATRDLIEKQIDWPCEIEKLYSDVNQGCRLGVSRAITWFFEHVDEGIILEDDCVPHRDFFLYCEYLLERYRNDTRIWCISGNNFEDIPQRNGCDYFFSSIPMVWGWATWKSRWALYDVEMSSWPAFKEMNLSGSVFSDSVMGRYWCSVWDTIYHKGVPDTWDYQWVFACISNGGLTILPAQNLVLNVGFGADAAHTVQVKSGRKALGLDKMQLTPPLFLTKDVFLDKFIFDVHFGGRRHRFPLSVLALPSWIVRNCTLFLKRPISSFFRP